MSESTNLVAGAVDPIFKGCTRPAMFVGVPLMPFLLVSGVFMIVCCWSVYLISVYVALFIALMYVPVFFTLKEITRRDDQRLRQLLLRARMRARQQAGRRPEAWGAVSFGPTRLKARRG